MQQVWWPDSGSFRGPLYKWPATLAWYLPIQVEPGGYTAEFLLGQRQRATVAIVLGVPGVFAVVAFGAVVCWLLLLMSVAVASRNITEQESYGYSLQ